MGSIHWKKKNQIQPKNKIQFLVQVLFRRI